MTAFTDAIRALAGVARLARADRSGLDMLDVSERGFWRSFGAIVLVAPAYLIAAGASSGIAESAGQTAQEVPIVRAFLSLLVQWGAWPLAMFYIARQLGLMANYFRYIIAYNWSSVIVIVAQMVPVVLFQFGLASAELAGLVLALIFLLALTYRWYVTWSALECSGALATALVLADLVLSLAIDRLLT